MADFFQNSIFKKKIPTIVGVLVLLVGGVAGILLVGKNTNFLPKASPEHAPKQIKITSVTGNSFTISWITDSATNGFLRYGNTTSLGTIQADERDQLSGGSGNFRTHYVTVRGLIAGTKYYFKIGSGESGLYDNNGVPFEITLGPQLSSSGNSKVISGTIATTAGSPAEGAIVYATIPGAAPVSALVRSSGSWVINLSDLRSTDLTTAYEYQDSDTVSFEIIGSDGVSTIGTGKIENLQPAEAITLGQPFEFGAPSSESKLITTDQEEEEEVVATESTTNTESTATSSASATGGFGASSTASSSSIATQTATATTISLDNPSFDGETVNTTLPEITGEAPPNTKITIKVESDPVYTEELTTDTDGTFAWSPPDDLEPGPHTITISYKDAAGILQTFKRSFVVMAAGESDLPALTSSPSATPKASPTPKPTASGSARVSVPSTSSGVPVAGSVSPTIIMAILGFLLLSSGLVLSKKLSV